MPELLRPRDAAEATEMLRAAAASGESVHPCGRASRLARRPGARPDGLRLSVAGLDELAWLDVADQTCEVAAGMSPATLDRHLQEVDLELGVLAPGADEGTLGGLFLSQEVNLLQAAYGPARDQVLGAQWLLADGTAIRTGARVVKSVAGYDLTRLLLGSEGRLAICLSLTLRLRPRPARLHWRRLPYVAWLEARASLPNPRHAFQLGDGDGYLAWPDPLPAVAEDFGPCTPEDGVAALKTLLNTFAAHPRRVALAAAPDHAPSVPWDW
ncbi:MAG: FAD-binding oxidoreductase, partial [Planctomycetota bacterium]